MIRGKYRDAEIAPTEVKCRDSEIAPTEAAD